MKYKVSVKSDILGDSERIMSLSEMECYNKCAYACALRLERNRVLAISNIKVETMGMWIVEQLED